MSDNFDFFVCNTIVRGPGQNFLVNTWEFSVNCAYFSASFLLNVCAIRGLFKGLSLAK